MALCTDHSETEGYGFHNEYAPYLYTSSGERLGRLPTNLNVIPEGAKFHGWQRMSGDFSHFVFSSTEWEKEENFELKHIPRHPVRAGRLRPPVSVRPTTTTSPNRTVKLVSKLPNGDPIPTFDPSFNRSQAIAFPGLSPNGSHILMQAFGGIGLRFLYMSVNDGPVMQIGLQETANPGTEPEVQKPVEPIGMNRSGSEVLFASTQKLTLDDTDTSRDIYMWSEATGKLTRLSKGNGQGDGDDCAASWTSGLQRPGGDPGTRAPEQQRGHQRADGPGRPVRGRHGRRLLLLAGAARPEQAGNPEPEEPLRLPRRRPAARRDAGTGDGNQPSPDLAERKPRGVPDEIEPDVVRQQGVQRDVHLRRRDRRHPVRVLQPERRCRRTGDARASQAGRFMADDGRAFFSTFDALVPRDQNGKIIGRLRVRRRPSAADHRPGSARATTPVAPR